VISTQAQASGFYVGAALVFYNINDGNLDGNDPLQGIGFKFSFNDNLALRLELERYDVLCWIQK
jgi:hypothetical protein